MDGKTKDLVAFHRRHHESRGSVETDDRVIVGGAQSYVVVGRGGIDHGKDRLFGADAA